jgi:hypothetical protein
MAFKISFHLTTVTKEAFQEVVFPTEGKTTEKFQSVCHLNNTSLSKVVSYKIYFNITTNSASGQPPSLSSTKKFYFVTCFPFLIFPVLVMRSPLPTIIYALTWLMHTHQNTEKYFKYFGEIITHIRQTKLSVKWSSYLLYGNDLFLNFHTLNVSVDVVRGKSRGTLSFPVILELCTWRDDND